MARNKILPYREDLRANARKLRRKSTYCELLLWYEIRRRRILGYQFHRQVPMLSYVVDFYCHELMLAIEVDGSSHDSPEAKAYDLNRQNWLEDHGVKFLRFKNEEITSNINAVVDEIKDWITKEVR